MSNQSERKLVLKIQAGDTTCAQDKGKFCSWVRTRKFGQVYHCGLFNEDLDDDVRGWLARLPACTRAER